MIIKWRNEMNADDLKKLSDKLFFKIIAGEALTNEEIDEMSATFTDKPQKTDNDVKWSIARKFTLEAGEYPSLFSSKLDETKEDKFSENTFLINSPTGMSAHYVPTPQALFLGDLMRAGKPQGIVDLFSPPKTVSNLEEIKEPSEKEYKEEFANSVSAAKIEVDESFELQDLVGDFKVLVEFGKEIVKDTVSVVKKNLVKKIDQWLMKKIKL